MSEFEELQDLHAQTQDGSQRAAQELIDERNRYRFWFRDTSRNRNKWHRSIASHAIPETDDHSARNAGRITGPMLVEYTACGLVYSNLEPSFETKELAKGINPAGTEKICGHCYLIGSPT